MALIEVELIAARFNQLVQLLASAGPDSDWRFGRVGTKTPLLRSPCDFQAGKKFSFPQKKRIRVR
jgi:hypothetical protein